MPPRVDEASWRLAVDGDVATPLSLSVGDLRRMPATTLTATLECAGNGRAFFDPPVAGIQWGRGAVGTARWTGVRLADLLKQAGAMRASTHVWMAGGDSAFRHPAALCPATADGQGDPPGHARRLRDERPSAPGGSRVSGSRNCAGMGRCLLGQVAQPTHRRVARARRVLGRQRVSLSHAAGRSWVRSGRCGHAATHGPRRQVPHHQPAGGCGRGAGACVPWPDSPGRGKPRSPRWTSPATAGRRGNPLA